MRRHITIGKENRSPRTSVTGLNMICAYLIYHVAKSHGLSALVRATAFFVFSLPLAGIAYLLS